ncbi:MAG: TraR/DksA family transcriptional regulator [Ferruginibacter sp.]|nr:TraR/DksA family transcriptional regulator [Ferruginibacter sp.]
MAIKKQVPAKAGKAAVKAPVKKGKAATPIVKKAAIAVKFAPAKKAVPQKAASRPAGKNSSKPIAKNVVVTKPAAKKAAKPATKLKDTKPVVKQVKKISQIVEKPLLKTTPRKVVQGKNIPAPIAKKETKTPVAVKSIPNKVVKPAEKIMSKKDENKSQAAITANEKAASSKPAAEVKAKDIKVPAPKPVVMPKISTKTVRKYQPEFTKSVLDKAQRDPGAPSQRYSDAELQEFRELIQRKLEAAKKELSYLHGLITRKDEMGGDEGDNRYMTMEDGSLSMEREQLSQMASRQITFIDHLEKAVMRIENKTYGICRVTGKLIDKARLRAVPHATLSIEAKMSGK